MVLELHIYNKLSNQTAGAKVTRDGDYRSLVVLNFLPEHGFGKNVPNWMNSDVTAFVIKDIIIFNFVIILTSTVNKLVNIFGDFVIIFLLFVLKYQC